MAITWRVEPDGRFVLFRVVDPYTIDEWRESMTAILDSREVSSPLTLLVDRRGTQPPTQAIVDEFSRYFNEQRERLKGGRCAIILSHGVDFEIAGMLRTVVRIPDASVRTFRDYDEAVAWLTRGSDSAHDSRDHKRIEKEGDRTA